MLSEAVVATIVQAVFTHLDERIKPVDRLLQLAPTSVQRALDPKQRAFGHALGIAYQNVAQSHPQQIAELFDASFLEREGAPFLAYFLTRHLHPTAQALVNAWADSLPVPAQLRPARIAEMLPIAEDFIVFMEDALLSEEDLAEVHNHRDQNRIRQAVEAIQTRLGATFATDETRTHYLHWLIDRNRYLDPRGTQQTTRQVQLKLDEVYISLKAQMEDSQSKLDRRLLQNELAQLETELADLPAAEQEDRRDQLDAQLGLHQRETVSTASIDLATVVERHDKLVILGDPGSGKTTLLRYLALQQALALSDGQEGRFPLLVRIADYAEGGGWKVHALSDFLSPLFKLNECDPPGLADLLQQELAAGGCLVLLDGLDEIVEADDRRGVVQRIEDFIRRHDQGGRRGANRFIVTSRISGYRSAPLVGSSGTPLPHYVVQEMDDAQIQRFLERWCRAVEDFQTPDLADDTRQATAQREIDSILDAVKKNPGVRRLAGNPLMLRVLALIHRTGARLPQKRVELYKLAADTLARTWRTAQGVPESALVEDRYLTPLLGKLAYWLHNEKPSGIATEREVFGVLGAEWARIRRLDIEDRWEEIQGEVEKFLLAVREHTGLFVERAPNRYGFMHLTFEEYYAARHLVARSRTRAQLIRQHLHDARWEEPILLALGFVGLDYPDEAAELVETAILAQGEEAAELGFAPSEYEELLGRDYLFALRCLGDGVPTDPRVTGALLVRVADELLYGTGLARFQRHHELLRERLEQLKGSDSEQQLATQLLVALADEAWDVRSRAAASLGKLGSDSPEVVAGLLRALRDEESAVRSCAAGSLGHLEATSDDVVAGLLAALCDESENVRYRAAWSLSQLRSAPEGVVAGLLAALRDKSENVRSHAAWSLGRLGSVSKGVVVGLLAALCDESENVRSRAAASLGQLGSASEGVVAGLSAALRDKSENVRSHAAESLGQLDQVTAEVTDILIRLMRKISQGTAWSSQQDAVHLFVRLMKEAEQAELVSLQELLHEDNNVRTTFVEVLIQLVKRFPKRQTAIVQQLVVAMSDPEFEKEDNAVHRTGQDYAHEALWRVVAG